MPGGYVLTSAGQEIPELAENMEEQVSMLARRVYARDTSLSGKLRVILPLIIATGLLMPGLHRFSLAHPSIELEIITSYETLNLSNRQADVAIRLMYDSASPPEHLYGRRLATLHCAVYRSANTQRGGNLEVAADIK